MIVVKYIWIIIISHFFLAFEAYGQTIILIQFDDEYEGTEQSNLGMIEIRVISELENKGFKVITESKDAWDVEESYREKRDFVFSFDAQYSVELIYQEIPKELSIEFKNWTDQNYNLPPKPLRSGRLTNYQNDIQLQALAIEWSRDACYFIRNNIIKRPEVAVEDFNKEQEEVDPKVIELMVFLKKNLPLYYLNTKISDCLKLKQAQLFEQCTSMSGHYRLNSDLLDITIEFENPEGDTYSFTQPNLSIPSDDGEFEDFTLTFIDLIDWPENLSCNE